MSLKARLRLAVAVLMSTVVIVTSGLYIRGHLSASFTRTHKIAESIGSQIEASIIADVERRTATAANPPETVSDAKRFWREIIETDPDIHATLQRALQSWSIISEVFVTDDEGRIRASSDASRVGQIPAPMVSFDEWSHRSLAGNFRQVFLNRADTELVRPVSVKGQQTPVFTVHVVISSVMLRSSMSPGLQDLSYIFLISLMISIGLAIILPTVVLNPLERLSQSIELMAKGKFGDPPALRRRETKEFAAVYSKLNLLGQQYKGARDDVRDLRSNVEQMLLRLEQAVLLFDPDGRLVMAGRQVRRLLGREPAALIGLSAEEIFPPESEIGAIVERSIQQQDATRDELIKVEDGSGEKAEFLLSVEPLAEEGGRVMGTLMTIRDAQSRGEIAAQLGLAHRLTALNRLTRGVAHEIKNPLNAMRLHIEVLRNRLDGDVPEVEVITREISRLDRVVKTFLDFNRPVEPQMRPINLAEVAAEVAQLVKPEAVAHGVTVSYADDGHAAWIQGDADLLKQAVLNVVMNAIEAMRDGGALAIASRCEARRVRDQRFGHRPRDPG